MRIETKRLELRSATPDDATHLQALFSNPDVLRYLPPMAPMNLEAAQERVQRRLKLEAEKGFAPLIISLKESGQKIGSCGLVPVGAQQASEVEIVYELLPEEWGKG